MNPEKDRPLGQFKWNVLIIYIVLVVVVALTVVLVFFTQVFRTSKAGEIPQLVWLMAVLLLLFVAILTLSKTFKILDELKETNAKLEKIAEALEENRSVLARIDQSVRLSEEAGTIASGDADKRSLREAVLGKLQRQDVEAPQKIIDGIANRAGHKELAEQLGAEVSTHGDTEAQEQIREVISRIEKLFENYEWAKASAEIEGLVKTYPKSEEAKTMRQKLLDKMGERKKLLLTAWDDAVQRRATDRSLEILRELDQYLTPNEGLALQEAAKDVFKTKLHNLGVKFSLAVSGKHWAKALEIGRQITRDFPNSKMAGEIREKLDVLSQKVGQQKG
jgi:hypothetical protein